MPNSNHFLFPKGRKNVGEDLTRAALRETYEETGYRCELLPHCLPTLATEDRLKFTGEVSSGEGDEKMEMWTGKGKMRKTTEPFAVTQRLDNSGNLKIIFWFLAQGDSTVQREEETQDEGEDVEGLWVDVDDVDRVLTFDDDKQIAKKAIEQVFQSNI